MAEEQTATGTTAATGDTVAKETATATGTEATAAKTTAAATADTGTTEKETAAASGTTDTATKTADATTKTADATPVAPTFTRDQLAASKKYIKQSDLIYAVLQEGKTYTIAQADAAIQAFAEKDCSQRKKEAN